MIAVVKQAPVRRIRLKGDSYFSECERDDAGHCLPSGRSEDKPSGDKPSSGAPDVPKKPRKPKPTKPGEGAVKPTSVNAIAIDAADDYKKNGTRAKAFKEWFGDWEHDPKNASKVVNAKGEPMVVYHGTLSDIEAFQSVTGHDSEIRGTFWFAEDPGDTDMHTGSPGQGGRVYNVYLNIRNPMRVNDQDNLVGDVQWEQQQIKKAKKKGHDGVWFYNNETDFAGNSIGSVFVAFDGTQIKSVNNQGTFDPKDARMAKAFRIKVPAC